MNRNRSVVDLEEILSGAQLAALPQSAIRLLELSQDPNNGPNEFAVPIESDPGLAGQVLRFVNSSYFGFSREISSVRLAITLVGIRTIKNFALWSAVFNLMPNPKCGPFDLKSLWQDSLRRGLFARAFGKHLGLRDTEELFAAALLQDMAVPLLAKELGPRYADLLEKRADGQRLSDLERESFGWTHADAGAAMANAWRLPESFVSMIRGHASLDRWLAGQEATPGIVAVALSALLPSASQETWTDRSEFEHAYKSLAKKDVAPIPQLLGKIDAEFNEFAPVLKVARPARTLVELFDSEPAAVRAS
jgi:HD-like signal output (HDOD) protein